MKITESFLEEMVKEVLTKMEESDLITKNSNKDWSEYKSDLKKDINALLTQLEDDKYKDAENSIDKVIDKLKDWKERINKNL
jgi:hypothetical protein